MEQTSTSDISLSDQSIILAVFGWELSSTSTAAPSYSNAQVLVACNMCQRRLGLWTFASTTATDQAPVTAGQQTKRPLHPEREHRTFCPVVNGEVQGGTWLISNTPRAAGLEGMRSRAGSTSSLVGRKESTEPFGQNENNLHLTNSFHQVLPPGWRISLNAALGTTRQELPTLRRTDSSGSINSIQRETEMRRERGKEILRRVRRIVGGND